MTSQLLNRPGVTARSALSLLNHLQDLPDHEVARAWREALCRERDLPPADRRRCALERAYAWLALDEIDPILTSSFQDALETFPETDAQTVLDTERDAALHGLSYADYQRLASSLPWLEPSAVPDARPRTFPSDVIPLAAKLLSNGVAAR